MSEVAALRKAISEEKEQREERRMGRKRLKGDSREGGPAQSREAGARV